MKINFLTSCYSNGRNSPRWWKQGSFNCIRHVLPKWSPI